MAKRIDAELRSHGASKDDIYTAILSSVGVTSSQLLRCVDGKLRNDMGESFNSQDGL